jgi:ABC-2 type transport system permease protein
MSIMLRLSLLVARRILIETGRNRRSIILWIVFPALMLFLFGWVNARQLGGAGPAFTATAPGILLGAAMFFSCLAGPVSLLVGERERRTLRRLLLTPLTGEAYFLGIVLAHLAIATGQAVVIYAITLGVGGGFHGSILLGVLIMALSATVYVGVGFLLGTRLAGSTEDVNGPVAAIGVPLLVLGGTFFSTRLLPPALWVLAQANPVFHMNESLKRVARGDGGVSEVAWNLLALGVFASVAMWLGARSYRSLLRQEGTR